jgi:hypothetical protein
VTDSNPFWLAGNVRRAYGCRMETMTFSEIRESPEKLDPLLKEGKTVRVTKEGQPYFDAVPTKIKLTASQEFDRKIEEIWAGSDKQYSSEEIVAMIRRSWG